MTSPDTPTDTSADTGPEYDGVSFAGRLVPPFEPVSLPADVPTALRPYRGPGAWQPGNLLHLAATVANQPTRYHHDLPGYEIDQFQDGYCRAGLAMMASTGYDGEASLPGRMWCGMPLFSGYVAALAVARTWRDHDESREDQTLHDRLTAVITAVWPTQRSIAETGPALHPALNLHRHLRTFYGGAGPQPHDIHRGIDLLIKVGTATGGQQRQIALWHLTRAAFEAVRAFPDGRAVHLGAALLDALPDDFADAEQL